MMLFKSHLLQKTHLVGMNSDVEEEKKLKDTFPGKHYEKNLLHSNASKIPVIPDVNACAQGHESR